MKNTAAQAAGNEEQKDKQHNSSVASNTINMFACNEQQAESSCQQLNDVVKLIIKSQKLVQQHDAQPQQTIIQYHSKLVQHVHSTVHKPCK